MSERLKARLKQDNIQKNKLILLFPFRFFDVTSRIIILSISYIYLLWWIFIIIIVIELLSLIFISIYSNRYDRLNHFVGSELNYKYIIQRFLMNFLMLLLIFKYIYYYL